MAQKLIIRLINQVPSAFALHWVAWKDDNTLESGTEANADLIKYADTTQQIYVLVPGEDILLSQVKLPKLSTAKLIKALPFALEDQLTEDPANMHFAVGAASRGVPIPVAVVSRDKMATWQAVLNAEIKNAVFKIKGFFPDVLAVPFLQDNYHIMIDDNQALVRTGKQSGFAIEKEALFPVLQLQLKKTDLPKPTLIQVNSPGAASVFTAEQIEKLPIPVQTETQPESVDMILAKSLDTTMAINLLQGDYAPTQRKLTLEQIVWMGISVVGIWLVLLTLIDFGHYFILGRERRILDNEIKTIFATVYPNQPLPENPKAALQKELNSLRASRSDSGFIRVLNVVAPTLAQFTQRGIGLKGLSYKSNQLILEVEASDLNLMEKLRVTLENQGLKVVLSNAQRGAGGLTETRFTIEEIS